MVERIHIVAGKSKEGTIASEVEVESTGGL